MGRPAVAGRAATLRVPGDPRPTARQSKIDESLGALGEGPGVIGVGVIGGSSRNEIFVSDRSELVTTGKGRIN